MKVWFVIKKKKKKKKKTDPEVVVFDLWGLAVCFVY